MSNVSENEGDNKEFTVVAKSDVTINIADSSNTSANDTATNVYFNNNLSPFLSAKAFALRPNQTCQIISINGITLTDPYTAIINKGITEKYDAPTVWKMVIRTLTTNTHIKLRIR